MLSWNMCPDESGIREGAQRWRVGRRVASFTGRAYRVQGLLTVTLVSFDTDQSFLSSEVTWLCCHLSRDYKSAVWQFGTSGGATVVSLIGHFLFQVTHRLECSVNLM